MRMLIPLPDRDFDVTEVAVPWRVLRDAGHQVVFATEQAGTLPAADPRLLTGVLFGQLGAAAAAPVLREQVTRFWATGRPVGAICHGVLVLARTRDAAGRSVLAGRRTTCLPKYMERLAYLSARWPGDAYLFARRFRDLLQPVARPA
jgi:putative intracellular protease/amidase